jgi:hypothetical protein
MLRPARVRLAIEQRNPSALSSSATSNVPFRNASGQRKKTKVRIRTVQLRNNLPVYGNIEGFSKFDARNETSQFRGE